MVCALLVLGLGLLQESLNGRSDANFWYANQGFSMRLRMDNRSVMGRGAYLGVIGGIDPGPDSIGLEYPLGQQYEHMYCGTLWLGGVVDTSREPNPVYLHGTETGFEGETYMGTPSFEFSPGYTVADSIWKVSGRGVPRPQSWEEHWRGLIPSVSVSDNDHYCLYDDAHELDASSVIVAGGLIIGGGSFGACRSTNNGIDWLWMNSGLTDIGVRCLAASGRFVCAGTVGHGVFLFDFDGGSWVQSNAGLTTMDVNVLAATPQNLFAGTHGGGVFLSTNHGGSWTAVNTGLSNLFVQCVAVAGANLFVGTHGGGVFLSTNNGGNWTEVSSGLSSGDVRSLTMSGPFLFAGTYGGGVFRSTDSGTTWVSANSGIAGLKAQCFAVTSSNIFVGTAAAGVFTSTNNGDTWTAVNRGLTSTIIRCFFVNGGDIIVATAGGLFHTLNHGVRWYRYYDGHPLWGFTGYPPAPLRLEVAQSSFVWSDPSAEAVHIVEYKIANIGAKPVDSAYVGMYLDGDVGQYEVPSYYQENYAGYYSDLRTAYIHNPVDIGSTPVGVRVLGASRPLDSLRLSFHWWPRSQHPPTDLAKYAALASGTIDSNQSIGMLTNTRCLLSVGPFSIRPPCDPEPDTVSVTFAIVCGRNLSVMRDHAERARIIYESGGAVGVDEPTSGAPPQFVLLQNYPNPFNPSTRIHYELAKNGVVRLAVFDILGHEVTTLVNEQKAAGRYEVSLNAAGLASGLYFYRIQAGEFVSTKKMLLLK